MAKVRCRAKKPALCRTHGNGVPVSILEKKLNDSKTSMNDRFKLRELKDLAEKADEKKTARGLVVEYKDGSNEVFLGDSTDPYHNTDYKFYSTETNESIEGFAADSDTDYNWDPVENGPLSVKAYKKQFSGFEETPHLYLQSDDGEGSYAAERQVSKIFVI